MELNNLPVPTEEEKSQYIQSVSDLPVPTQEEKEQLTAGGLPVPTPEESAQYSAQSDPIYDQVLKTISRPTTDSPIMTGEITSDDELKAIARAHGVDYNELRDVAPYFNAVLLPSSVGEAAEFGVKGALGFGGSVLGGIPQYLLKKSYNNENFRKALDDTRELAQAKKSFLDVGSEIGALPVSPAARAATRAVGLGRATAEGATMGGVFGLGGSREGEEEKATLQGAGIGAGLGAAAHTILPPVIETGAKVWRKIFPKVDEASPALIRDVAKHAENPDVAIDLDRGTKAILKETEAPRSVEKTVILSDDPSAISNEDVRTILSKLDPEERARLLDPDSDVGSILVQEALDTGEDISRKLAETMVKDKTVSFASRLSSELGEETSRSFPKAIETINKFRKQFGDEYLQARYNLFDEEEAALEYIRRNSLEAAPDTFSGVLRLADKLSDMKYVLRIVDEKYKTNLENIHNVLNSNYNKYTFVKDSLQDKSKQLQSMLEKSGLAPEKAYEILDKGLDYSDLPLSQKHAVEAYKKTFEDLRQFAEKGSPADGVIGVPIQKRENYVPYRVKDIPEYVVAVNDKIEQLSDNFGFNILGITDDQFRSLKKDNEFNEFLKGITYLDNREIKTANEFRNEVRKARTPGIVKDLMNIKAKSTFQRETDAMPEWIRNNDVRELLDSWTNNTLRYMYLREPLEQLKNTSRVLSKLGADRESEYLRKAVTDMVAVREGTVNKALFNMANNMRVKALEAARKAPEGSINQTAYETLAAGPEMLDALTKQMYPNYLGWNVPAIVRNLTQPLVLNVPELGYKYGSYAATHAYIDAAANYSKLKSQLKQLGLMPAEFVGEAPEYLARGIQNSALYKLPAKTLEKLGKVGMYLYSKSDEVNRVLTLSMSNKLTDDLVKGSKLANQALDKFPSQIKRSVTEALKDGNVAAARGLIARHLNSSTQFNYNKLSMSEFGRDLGPLFSTFSKWPTAIAGDIYSNLATKGAIKGGTRVAHKYLLPMVGLGMMQRALFGDAEEMDDREKKIVGSKGLADWAPVMALKSVATGSIMQPPAIGALTNTLFKAAKLDEPEPQEVASDVASGLIYSFVPGMGLIRFITDDMNAYINNERPEGNFLERTDEGIQKLTQ